MNSTANADFSVGKIKSFMNKVTLFTVKMTICSLEKVWVQIALRF